MVEEEEEEEIWPVECVCNAKVGLAHALGGDGGQVSNSCAGTYASAKKKLVSSPVAGFAALRQISRQPFWCIKCHVHSAWSARDPVA